MIHKLSKTAKDIVRSIAILGAAELILGIILVIVLFDVSFVLGHILGITYGTLLAIARMIHLEKSINASINLGEKTAATKYFRFMYFLRTLATAVALFIVFWVHPVINIVSVAVALLNAPIAAYVYKLLIKNKVDNVE